MTRNYRTAFNRLKAAGCPVFTREDDKHKTFHISAEQDGTDGKRWADYYDMPRETLGPFGVDKRVEDILSPLGLFAEWDNPASLSVWE